MDGTLPSQRFSVSGMHCGNCVQKVTHALKGVDDVAGVTVTLDPPEANIQASRPVALEKLEAALAPLGKYRVTAQIGPSVLLKTKPGAGAAPVAEAPRESLYPLFLIIGYIALTVAFVARVSGDFALHTLMANFMAGFFLVFSFFKLLDLRGFADAYRSYDLLAQAAPGWALAYPFVELALGVAYLTRFAPTLTNVVTLLLMGAGAFGVWRALANKQKLRCACLGTALNLPMTTVTLVEDIGMAAMAALMLLL